METSKQLYWTYLSYLQKAIPVYEALKANYASEEQIERTRLFINKCDALMRLHMNITRLNHYKAQ